MAKRLADVSRRSFIGALAAFSVAPAWAKDGAPDLWELSVPDMERLDKTTWVAPLAPSVWITCFTFDTPDLGWVPCNGLIIEGSPGPTIVDTGNNRDQGKVLLAAAKRLTGRKPVQAIATHFHADRTGGIAAMRAAKVPTYAHPYSVGLAKAYGHPVPEAVKGLEREPVQLGPVELFYPGVGHARDNITVWHGPSRTLFGGCLLRSTTAGGTGNLDDGDLAAFPATLARVAERYPDRRFTVPGHGAIAGDALGWTQEPVAAAIAQGKGGEPDPKDAAAAASTGGLRRPD